jgi:hypothetical protein
LLERLYGHRPRRSSLGPCERIWIVAPYIVIYELSESEDIVTVHGNRSITPSLLLVP